MTYNEELKRLKELRTATREAQKEMIEGNNTQVSFLGRQITRIELDKLKRYEGWVNRKISEVVAMMNEQSPLFGNYVEIRTDHPDYLAFPLLIYDGI